jgi:hypothetical protein
MVYILFIAMPDFPIIWWMFLKHLTDAIYFFARCFNVRSFIDPSRLRDGPDVLKK